MAHILDKETGKLVFKGDVNVQNKGDNTLEMPLPTLPNNFSGDSIPTRSALRALGFDNSSIGYNGADVTYNGAYALTPEQNDNGVTYTNTRDIINGANNIYKTSGVDNSVVDVTSYAASKSGLTNPVRYHADGTVTLGGIPIENTVIIDGNSYAPRNSIEAAVEKFKTNTGYSTGAERAQKYLNSTQEAANSYLSKINNFKPFQYDLESDPAYQAYKAAYLRNAQDAFDNTYAQNIARTGGYANSAALTASNNAYYNHLNQLADRIPELMENAYERYADEYDMLLEGLELYGTPEERYKIYADAAEEDSKAINSALDADYNRDKNNSETLYQREKDQREFERNQEEFDYEKQKDERDYWYKRYSDDWERENILMPQSKKILQEIELNDAIKNYVVDGYFHDSENARLQNEVLKRMYGLR